MSTISRFPAEPDALRDVLEEGDRILWSGRPRQGLILRPSDAAVIPFSLLWCGFTIFWEFSVIASGAPGFFRLWGVPFVLVGLHLVFGRFIYDAFQRGRTLYLVTNRRVLIMTKVLTRNIRSLDLEGLTEINLSVNASGRGTLKFGRDASPFGGFQMRGWPGASGLAPAFEGVEHAGDVSRVIRSAQKTFESA